MSGALPALGLDGIVVGRWPALEQRAASIDFKEAFHLPGTGIEIILEHLNSGIDFTVPYAVARKLMRARHHLGAVEAVSDVKFVEDAGHVRGLLFMIIPQKKAVRGRGFPAPKFATS